MLDRILADWPLKVLALLIAFGLWAAITGEDRAVKDLDLPLEVELDDDRILAGPTATTVTVRLEGPETLIRKLEPVGLAVRVDLRGAEPGERDVQLSESHLLGLEEGLIVTLFDPDRVNLVVDRRARRELPVVPDLIGEPPEGYAYYRAKSRPEAVWVEGPESALATLDELRTDPVRLDHTRSFVQSVGAVPDRPHVRVVDPRPLEVRVVIDAAPVEKAFDGIPVVLTGQAYETSVSPTTLAVTLTGPPGLLRRIAPSQIRAVADISELRPRGRAQQVDVEAELLDLPEDQLWRIGVKSVSPGAISVRVSDRRLSG